VGLFLVREDWDGCIFSVRVVVLMVAFGSYVRKGEMLKVSKCEIFYKMRSFEL